MTTGQEDLLKRIVCEELVDEALEKICELELDNISDHYEISSKISKGWVSLFLLILAK